MANIATEIAETIQTASIKRAPSPAHDINPSTAASRREPLTTYAAGPSSASEEDESSPSRVRPRPRQARIPPLPDLRFEQSYLASIRDADTPARVLWITVRDQVCWIFALMDGLVDGLVDVGVETEGWGDGEMGRWDVVDERRWDVNGGKETWWKL